MVDVPINLPKPSDSGLLRNIFCPRADRLRHAFALTDGAGTTKLKSLCTLSDGNVAANNVHAVGGGTASPGGDALDGTIYDSANAVVGSTTPGDENDAWASDAIVGAYLDLSSILLADSYYVMAWRNGSVNDLILERGTIMMLVKMDATTTDAFLPLAYTNTNNGSSGDVYGCMRLMRRKSSVGGDLRLRMWNSSDVVTNVDLALRNGSSDIWRPIIVTWGENGMHLYESDVANVVSNASQTDGIKLIASGGRLHLMADVNYSGSFDTPASFADRPLAAFAYWDCNLSAQDISRLMEDPFLICRPPPSETVCVHRVAPPVVIPRRDGMSVSFGGGSAPSSNDRLRVRYREDVATSWTTSASITPTANAKAVIELNGLSAGTAHRICCEFSGDGGATWQPMPGGVQWARTLRDANDTGSFSVVLFSDGHRPFTTGGATDFWDEHGINAPNRKAYCNWATLYTALTRENPELVLIGGDDVGVDGWAANDTETIDPALFTLYGQYNANCYQTFLQGAILRALGNHEGEQGFQSAANAGARCALLKKATVTRKRLLPAPTCDTYMDDLGIESGEGRRYRSDDDWRPTGRDAAGNEFDAEYYSTFIDDGNGDNASPLENFYTVRSGLAQFWVLDLRASNPGDKSEGDWRNGIGPKGYGGEHSRPGPDFALGQRCLNWLNDTLALSTAKWKIVLVHSLPPGQQAAVAGDSDPGPAGSPSSTYGQANTGSDGRYYCRDSGALASAGPDFDHLVQICSRHGVALLLHGHDHTFAHVERSDFDANHALHIIALPTAGAQSIVKDFGGWHFSDQAKLYGTAETGHRRVEASGDIVDFDGTAMPSYLKARFNVVGYVALDFSATQLVMRLVWATPIYAAAGGGNNPPDFTRLTRNERYAGLAGATGSTTQTPVPNAPRDVAAVFSDAAGEIVTSPPDQAWFNFNESGPANQYTQRGQTPADELFADTTSEITHAALASTTTPRRVMLTPVDLYTLTIADGEQPTGVPITPAPNLVPAPQTGWIVT